MTVHLHYECMCQSIAVEITIHGLSALAGSKDEVTLLTNKHTQTISPHCSTEGSYQLSLQHTETYPLIHSKTF